MIRSYLTIIALMFSMNAVAAVDVDTRGLSDAQKAELVKQAEAMKAEALDVAVDKAAEVAGKTSVDKVEDWVNLGEKIGKMLGGAAKEVGVAVNQFVETPVGKMTAAVIVWQYIGAAVVHIISGWLLLIIGIVLINWYARRIAEHEITYDTSREPNRLGKYPVKSVRRSAMSEGAAVLVALLHFVLGLVSIAIMFAGW